MRSSIHVLAVGGLVGLALSAAAAFPVHADSSWLTIPGGSPMFDISEIAPGDNGSATFTVTNPKGFPVTFSMIVMSLVTDDNGCNEPEQQAGDTTCGVGGGELQNDLRVTLVATGGSDRTVGDSTLAAWSAQPAIDQVLLMGHERRDYRVDYTLPADSTNFVQSDLVSFVFEMRLDEALDSLVGSEPPPVVVAATRTLPATGLDLHAVVAVAMVACLIGISLYHLSSQRRKSR